MKLSLNIFFLTFCCLVSIKAQKINYESSFEKAKNLAIQQKKPLAILITIEPPVYSPNFLNGLKDEKVIEKFNSCFINYKADRSDTAACGKIIKEYRIFRFPSFIFLDSKGGFLFTDIAFLSRPQPLLEIAEKAISSTKEKSLVYYDSLYAAGNISKEFLKDYILRREKAGMTNNAELIEKYVLELKVSDLYSYGEVLFILKAGPTADGNAYKLASLFYDTYAHLLYRLKFFDEAESCKEKQLTQARQINLTLSSFRRNTIKLKKDFYEFPPKEKSMTT